MIDAAYVCGKCKKRILHQDELKWVMYASLECEECSEDSWKYIDSKPSGYWTE